MFGECKKRTTITKSNKSKTMEVNRDILGKLLSISIRKGRVVDFEKALEYPLSTVPLNIPNADGTMRKTNKSELAKVILGNATNEVSTESTLENTVYIVDLISLIRTLRYIPETFEDLIFRVLKTIPPGYKRVDIASDSYHSNSIKSSEREKRGSAGKILLKSSKSKLPRDFNKFLSNSENKRKMVSIMFDVMEQERCKVLLSVKNKQTYISR